MLDALPNHLYNKSPDVFLRELLQNGVDAITIQPPRISGAAYVLSYPTDLPVKNGHSIYTQADASCTRIGPSVKLSEKATNARGSYVVCI